MDAAASAIVRSENSHMAAYRLVRTRSATRGTGVAEAGEQEDMAVRAGRGGGRACAAGLEKGGKADENTGKRGRWRAEKRRERDERGPLELGGFASGEPGTARAPRRPARPGIGHLAFHESDAPLPSVPHPRTSSFGTQPLGKLGSPRPLPLAHLRAPAVPCRARPAPSPPGLRARASLAMCTAEAPPVPSEPPTAPTHPSWLGHAKTTRARFRRPPRQPRRPLPVPGCGPVNLLRMGVAPSWEGKARSPPWNGKARSPPCPPPPLAGGEEWAASLAPGGAAIPCWPLRRAP